MISLLHIFSKKKFFIALFLFFITGIIAQNNIKTSFERAKSIEGINPDSALFYYKKALSSLHNNLTNDTVTYCYCSIARIQMFQSDFQNAFENALQCLISAELRKDTLKQVSAYTNLGIILSQQRKYREAIVFEKKSIVLARLASKHFQTMNSLNNLSETLANLGKHDSSIQMLIQAEAIAKKYHYEAEIPGILANLGNIYYLKAETTHDKKYFKLAASCALQAIEGVNNITDPTKVADDYRKDLAYSYGLQGAALAALGNYTESEISYEKAIPYYQDQKDIFNLNFLYYELTNVYINAKKNDKAIIYLARYDSLSKLLFSKENSKTISEMQTKYETGKKETENKLLQTENELSGKTIKQQKIINYFIIVGLILALLLAFFIFKGLKNQRKANKIISKQKEEVEHQKEIVDEKQKEILDSIRYARRIQNSLLTSEKYIERNLKRLLAQSKK